MKLRRQNLTVFQGESPLSLKSIAAHIEMGEMLVPNQALCGMYGIYARKLCS